jgi:long-chain fatty acid transport protein
MAKYKWTISALALALGVVAILPKLAYAQSFGIELNNTLMPASGGMGGASISRPQDLTSAMNANPATLTQFRGTQFLFGGAWAEPTFNLTQTSNVPALGPNPLITPYSAKSEAPGSPMGNIGVTQDFCELGLPVTFGLGFVTTAGGGVDFRKVPQSGGTNSAITVFNLPLSAAVGLTDRLSVGANMSLGLAFFDGPFVGFSGMTPDYALRSTVGTNYLLTETTTVGAYYQTEQAFRFDDVEQFTFGVGQQALDVNMDLPQNVGVGFADNSLMDGNLLVAVDLLYKNWKQAALFSAIYRDQFVVQTGVQYTVDRYRLRAGYAWAENPLSSSPGPNIGGVIQPGGLPAVRYTQGLMAITSQHRISGGVCVVDVLPGIDMDVMAGGMFRDRQQLGPFTATSIESYWVGFGLTWRFGRGHCDPSIAPARWTDG